MFKIVIKFDQPLFIRTAGIADAQYELLGFSNSGVVCRDLKTLDEFEMQENIIDSNYHICDKSGTTAITALMLSYYRTSKQYEVLKADLAEKAKIRLEEEFNLFKSKISEITLAIQLGEVKVTDNYVDNSHHLAKELESICCGLFISSGSPNYTNIHKAKEMTNVDIYAGEKDSFGWLSGVLDIGNCGIALVVFG